MKKLILLLIMFPFILFGQETYTLDDVDIEGKGKNQMILNKIDQQPITGILIGLLKVENTVKDGKVILVRKYSKKGQLIREAEMKDGKADGWVRKWNKKGRLLLEIKYSKGKPVNQGGGRSLRRF